MEQDVKPDESGGRVAEYIAQTKYVQQNAVWQAERGHRAVEVDPEWLLLVIDDALSFAEVRSGSLIVKEPTNEQ